MSRWRFRLKTVLVCMLVLNPALLIHGQTYHVGGSSQDSAPSGQVPQDTKKPLGWGSNIQNARLARAAEMALKGGNYAAAVDYAQRAAQAAPGDPQIWFLLGYAARLAGKSTLSVDAYNHGLHIDPSSLDGLSGLAQTYSRMGKRDEAEALLTRIVSSAPRRSEDTALLGDLLMQSGRYDQAVSVLERAEQVQPSARSELLMALCYQRLKQFDKANHELELAKQKAPDNPEVQRTLAGFYREDGNYSAAIDALRAIPSKTPDIIAELAYTYQLFGKSDDAAKLYSQAANAAPQDLSLQLSAAQANMSAHSLQDAQVFLKRAAGIDPENYRLHAIRGQIAVSQDHNAEAVREYSAALDHMPQSPPEGPLFGVELRMNLVDVLRDLQDDAAVQRQLQIAKSEIEPLDERGPRREEFLRLRARIRMNLGDLSGAESDVTEALALSSNDLNSLQLNGELLSRSGHPEAAAQAYHKVLAVDASNRVALSALGHLAREAGHDQEAEQYFRRLEAVDPNSYVPYLALGDLYTSRRDFAKAETFYRKGNGLAPGNSLIVAGGMNAAIEAHHLPLAADWLKKATDEMQQEPHVMREKERYLRWTGDYEQSAAVGRQVIKQLPHDRDVVVYLGYDLLHLEKYDELLALTSHYESILPKEPDLPLLAGYVHKHAGQLPEAQADFARALERDPSIVTAYVNRGYVENDLHQPAPAAADFKAALHLEPDNGEAHLGLAFSSLDLHQARIALKQAQLAEAQLGDSLPLHLIRATAYGETGAGIRAVSEYQAALRYAPNNSGLHVALAGALYGLRRYREAITELQTADKLSPGDAGVYAQMARSYAQLRERDQALHYVQLAEQHIQDSDPGQESGVLLADGEALDLLGEPDAAMQRFARALTVPKGDRMGVRLAVAHLMVTKGDPDGARRQLALSLMEAQAGETSPPTGNDLLQVADVFLGTHDFPLAQKYFQQALAEGAPETAVRVGLANSYLAEGDTARAQGQLSLIGTDTSGAAESDSSYQYLLAKASLLRQQHQNVRALTAFAQAADAAGEDQTANRELLEAGRDEGLRINRNLSFLSTFSVTPIFEDTTVYPLDAKLDVPNPVPGQQALLPLPRSSLETQWTGAYHLHFGSLPPVSGFFQTRNARGQISLPSANTIVSRDTTDYSFNIGMNPTLHLGNNVFTFNGGIQETARRDARDPLDMNQNLFRQFVYLSTSSFFNLLSVSGYAVRETGPFTLSHLRSRDLSGAVDFRVGRPWGRTALVTGMGARDEQFFPVIREFYFTSTYVGIERRISDRIDLRAVAEHLRSWRVESNLYAISQALRPAASVEFRPTRNWSVDGSFAYSRNMGFHAYDAFHSGFSVSYGKSIGRAYREDGGEVELRYPIRFTVGMQQEDFFNFPGANNQQLRPYITLSLF